MANSTAKNQTALCNFDEHPDCITLNAHSSQCQMQNFSKMTFQEDILSPPLRLNRAQLEILDILKLHPSDKKSIISNSYFPTIINNDINLQIPLSTLYSSGYLKSSNQLTFDDTYCKSDTLETHGILLIDDDDDDDDDNSNTNNVDNNIENLNTLNNKVQSYHIYKYSRHERDLFYLHMKHRLIKKNALPTINKFRSKDILSSIFNHTSFLINIPTKINSRQRIQSNTDNNIYPLLFSPNFNTLVKLSINPLLKNYLLNIRIYYNLINSIASQEFQFLVNNFDDQHQFSFTSLSFINILRQTMHDYMMNLQTSLKRNYFQSFNSEDHDDDYVHDRDNELSIPPLKIRRYDDSSYEIEKRSVSSKTTSSSSEMSITQIHNGHHQLNYDDRRRFDMRSKKLPMKYSDNQINSNLNDSEKKDMSDLTVGSPIQCDLSIIDQQQLSQDGANNEAFLNSSLSYTGEQRSKKNPSPILVREQTNESLPKYQSVVLNDGARIRIVNCSNDNNNKNSSSRNSSIQKRTSFSIDKIDENSSTKSTRINTRKISGTNSKTSDISEVLPTYQPQSVLLSNSDISHGWLTHSVFYRCHVCSHEEFFVVLSRECIRLHVSSKHGNMEENFKQRISNFLNNQGRALKIFQHYLKWQQPWSETEIDQIFQLSNINNRTNGAL